jgi:hypothetical protein
MGMGYPAKTHDRAIVQGCGEKHCLLGSSGSILDSRMRWAQRCATVPVCCGSLHSPHPAACLQVDILQNQQTGQAFICNNSVYPATILVQALPASLRYRVNVMRVPAPRARP